MISETLQYSLTFITEQTTLYCSIFFPVLQLISIYFARFHNVNFCMQITETHRICANYTNPGLCFDKKHKNPGSHDFILN